MPIAADGAGARTSGGASVRANGTRSVNVDPSPSVVSTSMVPPISSASRRLIARPSPVPPKRRVVDESTCENGWNNRSMRSGGMPMPESRTAICISTRPTAAALAVTSTRTSPRSVNFTAFDSRFSRIWRRRLSSPSTQSEASGGEPRLDADALSAAPRARPGAIESRTMLCSWNGCSSSSMRPASIFVKSSTSSTMASRPSPLRLRTSSNWR